jgi:hypothetical protein
LASAVKFICRYLEILERRHWHILVAHDAFRFPILSLFVSFASKHLVAAILLDEAMTFEQRAKAFGQRDRRILTTRPHGSAEL